MSGPISGLRVVDCSGEPAGVRLTGLLADYGADVVWVERPGGEPIRRRDPGATAVFARGKRSIELDLADAGSRDRVLELLDRADVFVETWPPGVAEQVGLDVATLHERNPALVHCSITGFGDIDGWRDLPGDEALVHALVGTMGWQQGHRDGPIFPGFPFASIGAAYLAAIGILACLLRRGDDGWGRHVETSLFDGALGFHSIVVGERDDPPEEPAPTPAAAEHDDDVVGDGRLQTGAMRMVTRSFECADGTYLGIHTGAKGAFGRLMQVVGLDDRIPPSATGLDFGRPLDAHQVPILRDELPEIIAAKPREEWLDLLLAADVCAVEHLEPTEVFDSAQAVHNEMTLTIDDPVIGEVRQVAPAIRFASHAASRTTEPAPRPGEHTDDVLATTAGWAPLTAVPQGAADTRPLLDGLRVLDLGVYYAGPYASRLLADLGADVIKVEPVLGDPIRGIDVICNSANAGKRSAGLDLKDPRVAPALEQLLEWADVVQHNLRPGVAERLRIDDERVHALHPDAVYVCSPGWGSTGPDRLRQSFAPMMSGYVGVTFEVAGELNPPMPPIASEDPGAGLLGAVGTLLALLERQRTGDGTTVENPQLNAAMHHLAHIVRTPDGTVIGARRLDPLQQGWGAYERLYETADGWVCVVAPTPQAQAALRAVVGIEGVGGDDAAAEAVAAACAHRDTASLLAELRAAGVAAVVPEPATFFHELLSDPEHRAAGRVVERVDGQGRPVRELGRLVRCSDAAVAEHHVAPALGADTDAILRTLGYDDAAIDELHASGAAS